MASLFTRSALLAVAGASAALAAPSASATTFTKGNGIAQTLQLANSSNWAVSSDHSGRNYGVGKGGVGNRGSDCGTSPGAVPEPASWATMLTGFGAIGFAMRRSRRRGRAVQAA